ncbi:MAG TPA: ectonucleotide pyrophosphatase/phosphodiesterase [Vicinamibacterales bacterium]|nr:ectonucleotide pyrophosphatase/phosphodiesterase [Vicinamibacterales bacterium]
MAALTRPAALRRLAAVAAVLLSLANAPAQTPSPALASAEGAPVATGSGGVNAPVHRGKPSVVLISVDGFRADYLDRSDVPNVRRVLERGARAAALIPVFPTLTFPNHYSLVTGLRPDRHGLVSNVFFDPGRQQVYSLRDPAAVGDGTWYRGEPIWITAERQGMVAACYFWPGSEAAIGGIRPTRWARYDGAVPNAERVDTVLEWLGLPDDTRPRMITLYLSDVDAASHRHQLGTESVSTAIRAVDAALGRLLDGLAALPARGQVFIVLTSDHGMTETSVSQMVAIDRLIDMTGVRLPAGGPVASLHVDGGPGRARAVRDALNRNLTHGRAYVRGEVPARLHYRADPRIGDVVVIMDEGFRIDRAEAIARITRKEPMGMHGWDPALPSMHGIFAVMGPGVRAGARIPAVENVDVYPFLAEVLGLVPAPDLDGRPGLIREQVMAPAAAGR